MVMTIGDNNRIVEPTDADLEKYWAVYRKFKGEVNPESFATAVAVFLAHREGK